MTSHNSNGIYLYAIRTGGEEREYANCGIGGGHVYSIAHGDVAAVVSDLMNGKLRPERRNIAAHRDVMAMLMRESTVLPMSFGIVADNRQAVIGILSNNRDVFISQLRRVAGKVEMGLRVTWDVPNIFEYFVMTQHELRAARDQIMGLRGELTQEQKIELGRLFDRLLNDEREAHTEQVEAVLTQCCDEIKHGRHRNEQEIMNLSCLVRNDKQGDFENAVLIAAGLFDNNYAFDYNGPWAPHNFVDIDLKL
ncbi:MAG: GvpL/GvpF family gas vesicle protein [bacterium]|nr:GvpL/GvpF family gas vesicle protein [Candidatus Sumerlaeota bacterium]